MSISSANNVQYSEISSNHEMPNPHASHLQSPELSSNQEVLISSTKYVKSPKKSSSQEILGLCPNHALQPEEISSNWNTPDSQFPEVSSNQDNEVMLDSTVNHEQVSSIDIGFEDADNSMNLSKRLSDALANLHAKEDMVKQHSMVAGEAVAGWEKAENEMSKLKQELEKANLKNTILQGKVDHLSDALKECVKQVSQARDEEEEKFHATVIEKTRIWESEKLEFKSRVAELESLLEFTQAEASTLRNHDLESKLEVTRRENVGLKFKLCSLSEEIRIHILEKELGIQAMEKASKQHLENIKKISKLEAECRRLRVSSQKISSHFNDQRSVGNSTYVESLTDSHSDSGERSGSDMWPLSLITELDQFKTLKNVDESTHDSSTELDLMDDFLEMERLAALDMVHVRNKCFDFGVVSNRAAETEKISLNEDDAFQRTLVLEETIERLEKEKTELDIILAISQSKLEESQNMLLDLKHQHDSLKNDLELKLNVVEEVSVAMPSQFKYTDSEAQALHDKLEISENDDVKVKNMDEEDGRV